MNKKNHSFTAIALTLLLCTPAYAGNDRDRDDDHRSFGTYSSSKHNDRSFGWGWNDDDRDDDKWDRDERWDDGDWGKAWHGAWKYELDDWKTKGWGHSHGNKVFICHRTSSRSKPYVLIKVSTSAKQVHLDHGDPANFTEFGNGGCRPATPPPPSVSLTLAASSIEVGATTTATWTTANTSACTLSNGATSSPAVVGPYPAAGNVTLTVTCTGLDGSTVTASQSLTVSAPPTPPVELTACSRLDSNNTLYFWAVDYYPDTGAFDGTSSSGTGPISGTITPAGDIMTAGRTITYSVDELGGVSSSASTVVDLDPTGDVLVGAYFRATNPVTGRNAAIAFVPGTTAACNLPAPR